MPFVFWTDGLTKVCFFKKITNKSFVQNKFYWLLIQKHKVLMSMLKTHLVTSQQHKHTGATSWHFSEYLKNDKGSTRLITELKSKKSFDSHSSC